MRRARCKASGFTLIELLVVIAVIIILAAILFPVFAQTREKARQAACLSNLKQIGTAVMLYVQDYDERYPSGEFLAVPGPQGSWDRMPTRVYGDVAASNVAHQLQPYVRNTQIFLDPSDPTGDRLAASWTIGVAWDTRFVRMSYWWPTGLSDGFSWPGYPQGQPRRTGMPFSLAQIGKPAFLPMVVENFNFHVVSWPRVTFNVCYADGHAKFTHLPVIGDSRGESRDAWVWDGHNPEHPLDIEKLCEPTCAEEAARDQ